MKSTYWGKDCAGCYADGTFGHQHCREVLASLVRDVANLLGWPARTPSWGEVNEALLGPMSDDAWEEDEAMKIIQERTRDTAAWCFVNGDLLLLAENENPNED